MKDKDLKNLKEAELRVHDMVQKGMNELHKQADEIFEQAIRKNAKPPIKGKLTKGKLKHRGITMARHTKMNKTLSWIEQRGVRISPRIEIGTEIKENSIITIIEQID